MLRLRLLAAFVKHDGCTICVAADVLDIYRHMLVLFFKPIITTGNSIPSGSTCHYHSFGNDTCRRGGLLL